MPSSMSKLRTEKTVDSHGAFSTLNFEKRQYCQTVAPGINQPHDGDSMQAEKHRTFERKERRTKSQLTPRELEIVRLLAVGKKNKDVATLLQISVKTAETHRAHILRKLGVHSICEIVLYAVRHKIITA